MESIKSMAARQELVPQSSGKASLVQTSGPRLTGSEVDSLEELMEQTLARYPNQTLPPGTPVMYGALWAEMVLQYGMETFTASLSKAIRDSRFFPDPLDIRSHCRAMWAAQADAESARKVIAQHERIKAQCERERAEDLAAGRKPTEQEARLNEILRKARREPVPQSSLVAGTLEPINFDHDRLRKTESMRRQLGVTPEQMAEARRRVLGGAA